MMSTLSFAPRRHVMGLAVGLLALASAGCASPAAVGAGSGAASAAQSPPAARGLVPTLSVTLGSVPAPSVGGQSAAAPSAVGRAVPDGPMVTFSRPPVAAPAPPRYGTPSAPVPMQASGTVLVTPTGSWLCPPYPQAVAGSSDTGAPAAPACQGRIPVRGLTAADVPADGRVGSEVWGELHVEGRFDGTTLTVTAHRAATAAELGGPRDLPADVPCPAPAGGWRDTMLQDSDGIAALTSAVAASPDRYGDLALAYPDGLPADAPVDAAIPQVAVVGVVGDLAAGAAALRAVFPGNLCVVTAQRSHAVVYRQQDALTSVMTLPGVMSIGIGQPQLGDPQVVIDIAVRTPELDRMVASIGGPPVLVDAFLSPVD